jgi:hypothetical protein
LDVDELMIFADRVHTFNGTEPWILFRALAEDYPAWWPLHPGEVRSHVIEVDDPTRVVWSSPWPVSPSDRIEFLISGVGLNASVRLRWLTESPPDQRGVAITRQRLNYKLASELRGWLTDKTAWRSANVALPDGLPEPNLDWMRAHWPTWRR